MTEMPVKINRRPKTAGDYAKMPYKPGTGTAKTMPYRPGTQSAKAMPMPYHPNQPVINDGDGPDSEGPGDIDTRDIFEKALQQGPFGLPPTAPPQRNGAWPAKMGMGVKGKR